MSVISYIRKLLMRDHTNENISNGWEDADLDPRERAALEEQLREEARRYEHDLRELAQT